MTPLIHIDANVPVYVWGKEHELKAPATRVLALAVTRPASFFTDAEVMQELLHRFKAIGRLSEVRGEFSSLLELMDGRIEPMTSDDVKAAAELALRHVRLSARDLIHIAIMQRVGSQHIVTADRAFDNIDGIARLDPARIDEWESLVAGN